MGLKREKQQTFKPAVANTCWPILLQNNMVPRSSIILRQKLGAVGHRDLPLTVYPFDLSLALHFLEPPCSPNPVNPNRTMSKWSLPISSILLIQISRKMECICLWNVGKPVLTPTVFPLWAKQFFFQVMALKKSVSKLFSLRCYLIFISSQAIWLLRRWMRLLKQLNFEKNI